jgi:hypothetical protein
VEAAPGRSPRSRRRQDLISALVGMYGSKEVLVNEYRTMLADRLLAKADYNTATDVRTLELLKVGQPREPGAQLPRCTGALAQSWGAQCSDATLVQRIGPKATECECALAHKKTLEAHVVPSCFRGLHGLPQNLVARSHRLAVAPACSCGLLTRTWRSAT